jgi:tight adherence protein B
MSWAAVLLFATMAGYGAHLCFTAMAHGWSGLGPGDRAATRSRRRSVDEWMAQSGLTGVRPVQLAAVTTLVAVMGAALGAAVFGSVLPAVALSVAAAAWPTTAVRQRRARRMSVAQEAWPRMIEEIRVLTGSLGRSVPQALFDVGRRGPEELRDAFETAHREWMLTTDFTRTVALLEELLADPTADATLETLLVAHELGGSTLNHRLEALAADRVTDVHSRRDARAKQAGVRFARKFVLLVPGGMALVGLQIGDGKAAYRTTTGQIAVVVGIAMVVLCWAWAGRMLVIPDERRVFGGAARP